MNELPYLKMLEYGNTCTALSLPDFVAGIPLGKEATGARMTAGDGGERSSATSGAGACATTASPDKKPLSAAQRGCSSHPPLSTTPNQPPGLRLQNHLASPRIFRHPANQTPSSPPPNRFPAPRSLINKLSHEFRPSRIS
jgi:hypothetical protein